MSFSTSAFPYICSSRDWKCPTCQASNLELLPDPDPTEGPRKAEALPDGLTIDPTGGKGSQDKGKQPEPQATTAAVSTASGSTQDAVPAPLSEPLSEPTPTQPTPTQQLPAGHAVPRSRSSAAVRPESQPAAQLIAAAPVHDTNTSVSLSHSERKLALIDRTLALLAGLVALLIIKRLV